MQKLTKRSKASRANGKLSRGPVSPEGKLRASANSTRHALLSNNLVLDDESKEVFAILHQQYIERINPTDGIEISLVEELASTVWRQRRLVAIETRMFNDAAAKRPEQTQVGRITGAFSDLSRGTEMRLLDRYESRLHRMVQRTLKNIQLLRQLEPSGDSSGELTKLPWDSKIHELPNEPRSEQPPVESTGCPTTFDEADEHPHLQIPELPAAESTACPTTSAADSPVAHAPGVPCSPPGEHLPAPTAPSQPPPQPTTKIQELPNEPKSPEPAEESDTYLLTSEDGSVFDWRDVIDPVTGRVRNVA